MTAPRILLDTAPFLQALGIDAREPIQFDPKLDESFNLTVLTHDLRRIRRPAAQPSGIYYAALAGGGAFETLYYRPQRGCWLERISMITGPAFYGALETPPVLTANGVIVTIPGEIPLPGEVTVGRIAASNGGMIVTGTAAGPQSSPIIQTHYWCPPSWTLYIQRSLAGFAFEFSVEIVEPYAA